MTTQHSKQGSSLVGALFIALFLGLAGLTYVLVVKSTGELHMGAEHEVKALYAAESGLEMGIQFLRAQSALDPTGSDPIQLIPANESGRLEINGHYVDVWAEVRDGADDTKEITVTSLAWNDPEQVGESYFVKRISKEIRTEVLFEYGAFYFETKERANNSLVNREFYGMFHANEFFKVDNIGSGVTPPHAKFHGATTTADKHKDGKCDTYLGVLLGGPSKDDCAYLASSVFKGTFENVPPMTIPDIYKQLGSTITTLATAVSLPASTKTPTLQFNADGSATYSYFDGSNRTMNISSIDGKVFTSAQTLNVHGTVRGNASLVTPKDVVFAGDLTYAGYNKSVHPPVINNNTDALGIVTGMGAHFVAKYDHLGVETTVNVGGDGVLDVNASIVSSDGTDIVGNELWDKEDKDNKYAYNVLLTGNMLYDDWLTNKPENIHYTFNQDLRLGHTIDPTGYPSGKKDALGLWNFKYSNWTESNEY